MQHTFYMPVIPKQQTADPWPSAAEARQNFDRFVAHKVHALAWGWDKPREFPISRYYREHAEPGKNYCKLPSLGIDQIEAAYRSYWHNAKPTRLARKKGRFERFLDRLIAWRTGANKIAPDWHVHQKAPMNDESWLT